MLDVLEWLYPPLSNDARGLPRSKISPDLTHSEHEVRQAASTVLKTAWGPVEGPNIIYGILIGPNGPTERGRSTGQTRFEITVVRGSMLDQAVSDPRHLGRDRRQRFAFAIGVERVGLHITLVLLPEAVLTHAHGDGRGEPEGEAQSGVAALGQLLLATELA